MKALYVLALALLLQACASSYKTALTPEQLKDIQNIDLYNLVEQDEVRPAVIASNSAAGAAVSAGLIGMMVASAIDSSINKGRAKDANSITEPLWSATGDIDYRVIAADVLNSSLNESFVLDVTTNQAHTAKLSKAELLEKLNALETGRNLFYISTYYTLTNNSQQILTALMASLFEAPETALTSPSKPIYRNMFFHESQVLGEGGEDSIALWLQNDAAAFKDELTNSLGSIASLLAYDIKTDVVESCIPRAKIRITHIGLDTKQKVSGPQLNLDSNLVQIRDGNGMIYSIAGTAEEIKELTPEEAAGCSDNKTVAGVSQ